MTLRSRARTRYAARQAAHGREAGGALGDAHAAARVQYVERLAQAQQLAVGRDGQPRIQQPARLLQ